MAKVKITDFLIYRWRYQIGYTAVALLFTALLLTAFLYSPNAVSNNELNNAVTSAGLSFGSVDTYSTFDLPYQLVQQGSVELFGATHLGIKLPSLLFAALSAVGMVFLLRRWFKYNVAVLASILAATTGQFLFIAQSGTPSIMYVFWPVWILLSITMLGREKKWQPLWVAILGLTGALSLYTPLMPYVVAAIGIVALVHPRMRYLLRSIKRPALIAGALMLIILSSPVLYGIHTEPSLALDLLGLGNLSSFNLSENLTEFGRQYFTTASSPSLGYIFPIFTFASLALMTVGAYRLFTIKHTAKSYIILAWVALLIPALIINPIYTTITFVPALLLMALGIEILLKSWYSLFPKNPYARIAGLVPLIILVSGLVLSGVERHVAGYRYDPDARKDLSSDLLLIDQLVRNNEQELTLHVSDDEQAFYELYVENSSSANISIVSSSSSLQGEVPLVTHEAFGAYNVESYTIDKIVTSPDLNQGDRFYLYKNNEN